MNSHDLLALLPWCVIALIVLSLYVQGWMVHHERHGYQANPKMKSHPEIKEIRGTGFLMTVNFNNMPDDVYNELQDRINKLKMEELFEEPSTYEDELEDE